MSEIVLDFETRSFADLKAVGSSAYSQHITTEILSLVVTVGDEEPFLWLPTYGCIGGLARLARDPNHIWICHNAGFEKDCWRHIMAPRFGFPDIPNDRWHDIAAVCALKNVGIGLDQALSSFKMPGKDLVSSKFVIGLSKPDRHGNWDNSEASMERCYAYNRDDVVKEKALHRRIGYLPPAERAVWLASEAINERGVLFDLPMVRGALAIREAATVPLVREFRALTGVNPTQVQELKKWLVREGVELPDMRKERINKLLGLADESEDGDEDEGSGRRLSTGLDDLPGHVRRALFIRTLVGSSSVSKYGRMAGAAGPDGRIRRLLRYHGAGTGRWTGGGINAHNMPRGLCRVAGDDGRARPPSPEDLARAITSASVEAVDVLDCFIEYGGNRIKANPIEVLQSGLRPTIIAEPGKVLLVGDWAQVEPRLSLAFAGQRDKLAVFASGADPYLDMAERIFNKLPGSLNKNDHVEMRQTGKNTINGCNFGMGADTFCQRYVPECACRAAGHVGQCLEKVYEIAALQPRSDGPTRKVLVEDNQPPIAKRSINTYRKEWAPYVPVMWKGLADAAMGAVHSPGKECDSGFGITYQVQGEWLVGRCPDGSQIFYFHPTMCRRAMPWDPDDIRWTWRHQVPPGATKVNAFGGGASGRWVTVHPGLLMENFIQHMGRQMLCRALLLCEQEGLPVILHNQDMIMVEHDNPDVLALKHIMENRSRWQEAIGLPIAAECHKPATRYS